ncbi:ribosome biogenesis GTPase YlqF [Abyssisolibacter fermentans]|uniref:ribosome biogenesis GTPase YlqF n=1 Tax=Abyssisolibacter fermentans TaxID=1766203 RepID=UPI00082C50F1|nr:ribosome biogenesis GTPase YlqF [Abyssisolibacter fermentans]
MNINWFPGHMKKTRDLLKQNLSLVDVVIEILDARIPISSKNPEIDKLINNKKRIVILNKSDLSDKKANEQWVTYLKDNDTEVILNNALTKNSVNMILKSCDKLMKEKRMRLEKRGIKNKVVKAMIVGIPNVGKSTLINSISGRKSAKTGNRPGVTKGKQWIRLKGNIELLDTPGILWPKFENQDIALSLAFTGAIKDEIMDTDTLAYKLVEVLSSKYPHTLIDRYEIELENKTTIQIIDEIALKRGCVMKNKEIDYTRISNLILDEFRKGKLGRITLELPEDKR